MGGNLIRLLGFPETTASTLSDITCANAHMLPFAPFGAVRHTLLFFICARPLDAPCKQRAVPL